MVAINKFEALITLHDKTDCMTGNLTIHPKTEVADTVSPRLFPDVLLILTALQM